MPQHRRERKSLRATERFLCCETLEKRAMLTALIASAEIAPGPVAQFTAQARTFVESTLEHVKVTQHQTPVKSSMDSLSAVAEDGRPIRIANYTLEMDDLNRLGSQYLAGESALDGNLSSGHALAGLSAATSMSGLPMRSSLVFSFLIYPDNSVSLRARWSAPLQWSGFAASGGELQAARGIEWGVVQDGDTLLAEGEPSPWPVVAELEGAHLPLPQNVADREAVEWSVRESRTVLADVSAENESIGRQRLGVADAVPFEVWDGVLGHWCVVDFADGEAGQVAQAIGAGRLGRGQQVATDSATVARWEAEQRFAPDRYWLESDSVLALPVPEGMIALDFLPSVMDHAEQAQVDVSGSAIYQVFVHAAESPQVVVAIDAGEIAERSSTRMAWTSVEPSDQPRWTTQAMAWLAAAGGVVWAFRPQRGEPLRSRAHRAVED